MVWFYQELRSYRCSLLRCLSIPLWSDFITISTVAPAGIGIIFQSHYGLILSNDPDRIREAKEKTFNPTMVWFYQVILEFKSLTTSFFQSHYGLILSQKRKNTLLIFTLLSIPLWSDFITKDLAYIDENGNSFNPTMVWFYPSFTPHSSC